MAGFQYTKLSLKTALTLWNVNSDPNFAAELDAIVSRGELLLSRELDLDNLDISATTPTVIGNQQVAKPAALINPRLLVVTAAGTTTPVERRSRAWVALYNSTAVNGRPKYYCEDSETNWRFAPAPDAIYTVTVHGNYQFTSISSGADGGTTWFSSNVPDLLYYACSVEACEFLKYWDKKAANEATLKALVAKFLGIAETLQRTDPEDLAGNLMHGNQPSTQGSN